MKVEIFDKDTNHTLVTLDNVKDVTEGFECGIGIESYKDIKTTT